MIEKLTLDQDEPDAIDTDDMSELELLAARAEIDKRLKINLADLNLQDELALQLRQAKLLYNQTDEDTPANQKAQILNTISAIVASISKTSAEVYSVERLKKIEAATLAAIQPLDNEAKQRFFDLYEKYLNG